MADGSIIIDTLLRIDGYMKNMKKLHASQTKLKGQIEETTSKIDRLGKEINDLNNSEVSSAKMDKLKEQIASCDKETGELKAQMDKLEGTQVPTQKFNELQKFISNTEVRLNKLLDRESKMSDIGKRGTSSWKNLQYDIEEARRSLAYAKGEMEDLKSSGGAYTSGANTAEYDKLSAKLSQITEKRQKYNATLDATKAKEEQSRDTKIQKKRIEQEKLNRTLDTQNAKYEENKSKINSVGNAFSRLAAAARQNMSSRITNATEACRKGISKLSQSVSRFTKRLLSIGLSVFVFTVLTKIMTGLKDRMGLLLKKNQQFSSSLAQIKGNLKTAFQTIYEAALPALNSLMSILAKVTAVIANFTAALFGKSVKASQEAAEAADSQAESVSGVGEAAKKASEYLNGYDEMNVQASSDSSSSGGGGSSTGTTYEDIDVNSGVSDFINRIKAAWETADFTELGNIVGNKIKSELDSINWDSLQSVSYKIGKSLATFMNGVLETEGLFTSVGKTVAEALNTALEGAWGFSSNFHWDSAGKAIADSINGFFKTFDFKKAGLTFTEFASGALSTLTSAIAGIDWSTVGQKIVDLISSIDWIKLSAQVATALLSLISSAVQLLFGLVSGVADNLSELFETLGLDGVAGFFKGMSDNLKTSASWVKEKFQVILDAVKDFFGIHSPSTVFAEIGGYMIDGLKNGLSNAISNIKSWIKTNIVEKVTGAMDSIKEFSVELKGKIDEKAQEIKNWFADKKEDVKNLIANAKDNASNVINKFKDNWNAITDKTPNLVASAKNNSEKVLSTLKGAWEKIISREPKLTATAENKNSGVLSTLKSSWTTIKKKTAALTAKATNKNSGTLSKIKSAWGSIYSKTAQMTVKFIDCFTKPLKAAWNALAKAINGCISVINKIPGVNISGRVPQLAKGAVIPPNAPFLAMLGDQKNGTNIETPLSTMIEAFIAALDARNDSDSEPVINVYVGGQKITDYVIKDVKKRTISSGGKNPLLV